MHAVHLYNGHPHKMQIFYKLSNLRRMVLDKAESIALDALVLNNETLNVQVS